MKADKTFYDTLREEVKQGNLRTSHSYFVWGRKIKSVEPTTTSQASEGEKQIIQELKGKIEGLESQIELLEEANRKLTEKNRELEAKIESMHVRPDEFFLSKPIEEKYSQAVEEEAARAAFYRLGYVSLQSIINFGNTGTADINEARLVKDLIHNSMPILSEEERILVNNIGYLFREANLATPKINVQNTFESGSNNVVANRDINNPQIHQ